MCNIRVRLYFRVVSGGTSITHGQTLAATRDVEALAITLIFIINSCLLSVARLLAGVLGRHVHDPRADVRADISSTLADDFDVELHD